MDYFNHHLTEIREIPYEPAIADLSQIPVDDPLDLYLGEVSYVPLLTADEEVQLAMDIESGKVAQNALETGDFTDDERDKLSWLVEVGEAARSQLASANMRLVISIAKKYRGRGIDFPDLVQEGNIGLMIAVDKFDYTRGNRFSTHATWWIRQAVGRAIANYSRLIRIPVNLQSAVGQIYGLRRRFLQDKGREPSIQELADVLDLDTHRVKMLMSASRDPLRFQQLVSAEDDRTLEDVIEDSDALEPAEEVARSMMVDNLYDALDEHLPVREAQILRLYYGLQGQEPKTFFEISEILGLSRERVRQLQKRAVASLFQFS
jgi:RNA polymerase primary sigma factor